MADSSFKGILSLNDVRIKQAKNVWPVADTVVTISNIGSQNYLFTIDTQRNYTNQFLYYALNSVDTGNSISASDFEDNNIQGELYFNASGTVVFTKKLLLPAAKKFNLQLRTGSLAGTNVFTSSNLVIAAVPFAKSNIKPQTFEYLIVAGGGAGGSDTYNDRSAGGGGAGGFLTATGFPITAGANIVITVGSGGAGATGTKGGEGSNSSIAGTSTITSIGGGGGAGHGASSNVPAGNGGSGGGATHDDAAGPRGLGTAGQGNNGGTAGNSQGGAGNVSVITGSSVTYAGGGAASASSLYAGGGGGGAGTTATTGSFNGGAGGGGNSGQSDSVVTGTAGTPNTGGGGGGSRETQSGAGGSGVVIIRYPDYFADATTTGNPNVITSGGYLIYRFWQSGSIIF
jgi:hypothetical protein